ncbi:MAG: hypothetical protein HYT46_00625 [Candidatus Vogelbacteria bacterium]|nr:hypothetical protein [Candidatus Vogelbacteria bacterium]
MAIDLLQLDRDCAMPTILRRKWKEMHGYDPVQEARNARRFWSLLILSVLPLIAAIVWSVVYHHLFPLLMVFILVLGPLLLVIAFMHSKSRGDDFACALEKLEIGMPSVWPPDTLYEQDWEGLRGLAEMGMKERIGKLLAAEHLAKENTDWSLQEELDKSVARRRQELKAAHAALLAFELVDEKWDRYFAEVPAEPATKSVPVNTEC